MLVLLELLSPLNVLQELLLEPLKNLFSEPNSSYGRKPLSLNTKPDKSDAIVEAPNLNVLQKEFLKDGQMRVLADLFHCCK